MSALMGLTGLVLGTWVGVAQAEVSVAQAKVFMKCETTFEFTKKSQYWFVYIEDIRIGATIKLKQQYESGQNEWIYEIWWVDEAEIKGFELIDKNNDFDSILVIDRMTGRMSQSQKYTVEQLKEFWNEKKQQLGGYDEDTWFGTNFDCVIGQRVF